MSQENNLEVYFSIHSFTEEDLRGKTAVIIDVLRASTTIVTALNNGAKKIIPVEDMEAGYRIVQSMNVGDYLLAGEKNGVKIEGYHLGNSPAEYTEEAVKDKTIVLNTTNGTKTIKKAQLAKTLYIGSFLNQNTILEAIRNSENPLVLVCSGWHGYMSLEDTLFAGSLIHKLYGGKLPEEASDGVKVAFTLYEKFSNNLEEAISNTDHAKRLRNITPNEDIAFACKTDIYNVLPGMIDGIITNING